MSRSLVSCSKAFSRPLPNLFDVQAGSRPDSIALEGPSGQISYRTLQNESVRIANALASRGVHGETAVGLLLERSPALIATMLGVLRCGAFYLPLDPSNPYYRLVQLLESASVAQVVTDRAHSGLAAQLAKAPVVIDEAFPSASATEFVELPHSQSLAYSMYTSGSTGAPKGVAVPHLAISRLVQDPDYAVFNPAETLLQISPPSFDASTFEIWGALLNGCRLVVPAAGPLSLDELTRLIATHAPSPLFVTTALFIQIADWNPRAFAPVRQLLTGGEVIPPSAARTVLQACPATRLSAVYGPTENTTFSTHHPLTCGHELPAVPLGRALRTDTAYVVDNQLSLAGDDRDGELYLTGPGLARGYLDQPRLTASRFVAAPWPGEPGARMYRTGDLARRQPDGVLTFKGRIDNQVKIRGHRVEPGEIEYVLRQDTAVVDLVVLPSQSRAGHIALIAFVATAATAEEVVQRLKAAAALTLPDYMRPAGYVCLPAFPLSAHGKIDRAALLAAAADAMRAEDAETGGYTSSEASIARIWSAILNTGSVARDTNLFAIGGDSLDAMRILAEVSRISSAAISVREFLSEPTIQFLASRVSLADRVGRPNGVRPAKRSISAVPSWAQERVWFMQQLAPDSLAYSFAATLTFLGPLNVSALETALHRIVARHDSYRTTFTQDPHADPVAHVHDNLSPFPFRVVTISHDELDAAVHREMKVAFSLSSLPLVRWTLFRIDIRQHVLLAVEHHIVHDGWSFNVFLGELLKLYAAMLDGTDAGLPSLPMSFGEYATAERQWTQSLEASRQLTRLTKRLHGRAADITFPTANERPFVATFAGDAFRVSLDRQTVARATEWTKKNGITMFATYLAAFAGVLHVFSKCDDLCVGVGLANRRKPDTHLLIGMLVNTGLVRIRCTPETTLKALVAAVWNESIDAYDTQEYPFSELVRAIAPRRLGTDTPLVRTMFSMHDSPFTNQAMGDVKVVVHEGLPNGYAKFDLNVIVIPPIQDSGSLCRQNGDNEVVVSWEYSTELFTVDFIRTMAAAHSTLLDRIACSPDSTLADFQAALSSIRSN